MNKERDLALIKAWAKAFFAMDDTPKFKMTDEVKLQEFSMGTSVKKEICPACNAGVPKKEYFIVKARDEVPEGKALIIGSDFNLISFSLVDEPIDKNAVIKTVIRPKRGAKCTKCKQDYPYAENRAEFVCWACRNGY